MSSASGPEGTLWNAFEGGKTLRRHGSEGGLIVRDEEHVAGARITLEERAIAAPFAVTCGIYGVFVHTAFAADQEEGNRKYDAMKARIEEIICLPDQEVTRQVRAFTEAF